jgi:urease accessory protein
VAKLVTAGVRLVPLGQTHGQLAIADLEPAVLAVAGTSGRTNDSRSGVSGIHGASCFRRHMKTNTRGYFGHE